MIIAEIGLNHLGSEARAARMLEKLLETCVDAITFQIPIPEFYSKIKEWGGPLSVEFYKGAILLAHKRKKQIGFCIENKCLISELNAAGADFWKTFSWSLSDNSLHNLLQATGKPVFASTGLADEREILRVSRKFKQLVFIHTQLSHNIEDANLRVIKHLREVTKREIAFGLHCSEYRTLYLSLAFEPAAILFYVKEKEHGRYPDNKHALPIAKVDIITKRLKNLSKSLGSGQKRKMRDKRTVR